MNIGFVKVGTALRATLVLVLLHLSIACATAGERAALVIGNQRYAMAPLDTPEADAKAMADRLRKAGYRVTRLVNLGQTEFYDAVDAFFSQHKSPEAMLFYYAGHAVQIHGKNFLIPVDVRKEDPDVLSRLFDLRYLVNKLTESRTETKLVILDACRDNIFSSNPNAASGLSELIAPPGTFVAFSTAPGATAEDGDGDNSPYTTALLESLFRPNVKIEDAFKEVRRRVRFLTENVQTPWESTSLVQDFYVVSDAAPVIPVISSTSKETKTARNTSVSRSFSVEKDAVSIKDKSVCSRILAKMSIGIDPLTEVESAALAKCRQ